MRNMEDHEYIRIAEHLLENGTVWQKKCIKLFMWKLNDRLVSGDMRWFIDNLIKNGKIEV